MPPQYHSFGPSRNTAVGPASNNTAAHEAGQYVVGADWDTCSAAWCVVQPLVLDGRVHLEAERFDMHMHQHRVDDIAQADVSQRGRNAGAIDQRAVTRPIHVLGFGPTKANSEFKVLLDH